MSTLKKLIIRNPGNVAALSNISTNLGMVLLQRHIFVVLTFWVMCHCFRSSDLWPATLLKKETLAQVFSCEFCQSLKKIFERLLLCLGDRFNPFQAIVSFLYPRRTSENFWLRFQGVYKRISDLKLVNHSFYFNFTGTQVIAFSTKLPSIFSNRG